MDNQFILSPYYIDKPAEHLKRFAKAGWQINEVDLPDTTNPQDKASAVHKGIADKVEAALKEGKRPISVAGDCCATIPVYAGLQRAGLEPSFLWLDSHGDFNTWETTPSGFLGGMPLAMMAGLGEQRMPDAVGLKTIPVEKIILADGRDLDPGEQKLVESAKIKHIKSFEELKTYLFNGPVYLHFDVDVLHLDDLPAVNYPAKGGPHASEVAEVFRVLKDRLELVALSCTIGVWNTRHNDLETGEAKAWSLFELLF